MWVLSHQPPFAHFQIELSVALLWRCFHSLYIFYISLLLDLWFTGVFSLSTEVSLLLLFCPAEILSFDFDLFDYPDFWYYESKKSLPRPKLEGFAFYFLFIVLHGQTLHISYWSILNWILDMEWDRGSCLTFSLWASSLLSSIYGQDSPFVIMCSLPLVDHHSSSSQLTGVIQRGKWEEL